LLAHVGPFGSNDADALVASPARSPECHAGCAGARWPSEAVPSLDKPQSTAHRFTPFSAFRANLNCLQQRGILSDR
jgi:hypothetical protein